MEEISRWISIVISWGISFWEKLDFSTGLSIVSLVITILTWRKATNANKSAIRATRLTEKIAEHYSDHLTLHSSQRLIHLIKLIKTIEKSSTNKDLCEYIRHEIENISAVLYGISQEDKLKLREFMVFLDHYSGDDESQNNLCKHQQEFRSIISRLSTHHNKNNTNKAGWLYNLRLFISKKIAPKEKSHGTE